MEDVEDPTAWILNNEFANFVLMNTNEIKYMCMVGYTFLHGCKVFKKLKADTPATYKFVNLAMACTGGGILVPIFLNTIPVTLAIDAYPIAILASFLIHTYIPSLREVVELSDIFKALVTVFYESIRCYVVTLFTGAAAAAIAPSQFSFPIFGPIICGTIGGCGGAFLPLDKGLAPLKDGLPPPVFSAFVGATFFHFFTHFYANDVVDCNKKAKVIVAFWFISYAFYKNGLFPFSSAKSAAKPKKVAVKVEKTD